jgi:hypothetical protein
MTLGTATGSSSTLLGLAIGDWAAYLASGVAVLVAVAAWIQAKRATKQNAYGTTASLLQDMNRIFIESPELRPLFFEEGGAVPDSSEQKAQSIASYVLNVYEAIWSFAPHMGESERKAWRSYIRCELAERKILADMFAKQRDFYPNLVEVTSAPG